MTVREIVKRVTLSALTVGEDGTLPTEFRLFAYGDNPNTKGNAIFDADAAASVMAKYAERGCVDVPIDLEHRSLDDRAVALTKDATDSQGWLKLELRPDGLWAVDVHWTPEGAERLLSKKQRYMSPAFCWLDEENGRVGEIINVALVSMPALHNQPALIAASRLAGVVMSDATRALAKQILHGDKLRASVSRSKAQKR